MHTSRVAPGVGTQPAQTRWRCCPARRVRCAAGTEQGQAVATRSLQYTALEGNTFKLCFPSTRITVLADPWLVGPLTFGPPALAALYSGVKPAGDLGTVQASDASVLLLSQGLDDHAHRPTLEKLDKRLPVVASPSAAAVATALGFTSVQSVPHGQSCVVAGLRFTATQGALVGPPWSTRENGFFISEESGDGLVVYYEPHLDYTRDSVARALQAVGGRCDVAVVPTTAVSLAGYPLVMGSPEAVMDLIRLLQPAVLVPLRNDQIKEEGAIAPFVQFSEPSIAAVRAQLAASPALRTRLVEPAATGSPLVLDV
jgi:L-ascorbate metabolism protein UlaG (beta-lactamase superfamily)